MKNPQFRHLTLGVIAATASLIPFLAAETARAATLSGDWYYSIDSFNDSTHGNYVGDTIYEIYGMAMKQTADEVIFAVNSHLPIEGIYSEYAEENVGWGDLLLNFTGQNLDTASATSQLWGIRWANNDDSGATQLGVYNNVSAKSVAIENGLDLLDASLQGYNNYVSNNGGTPSIGDLPADDPYFNPDRHIQNVIASGTRVGDVNVLENIDNLGLNFAQFGATGNHTLAFTFDRSLLPDGDFIAHLAPECDNDVIAMIGNIEPQPAPEPSTVLPVVGLGLVLGASRLRRGSFKISKLG